MSCTGPFSFFLLLLVTGHLVAHAVRLPVPGDPNISGYRNVYKPLIYIGL